MAPELERAHPVSPDILADSRKFSQALYERMQSVHPGVADLEPYEFGYALDNMTPAEGWGTVTLEAMPELERRLNDRGYYQSINLRPCLDGRKVMDREVLRVSQMLFVGLVTGAYPLEWIRRHFYFDLRGFYFLHRTGYFTPEVLAHLGGKPWRQFEARQRHFQRAQAVGYKAFKEANQEIDACFIDCVLKLVERKGTPILIAIAGQTAAGKTEIVARLSEAFESQGKKITGVEMDHFLTDRDYREAHGIDSLGKEALHFGLLQQCLKDLCQGKRVCTPRYDFIQATSSHDLQGKLKPGCTPLEIEPADIIFIEGNFPFLFPEIAPLIGIKVVYLTDDAVRLQRKWKRDMDYRKKYDLMYFLNRYFREQFLMAQEVYIPQMEACDLLVDTSGAALWASAPAAALLEPAAGE